MQKVSTVSGIRQLPPCPCNAEANADLIARWSVAKETQVNVAVGNGEPVAGKRNTWSNENGTDTWHPFRIPHDADSKPNWRDYPAPYLLGEHAEGIGIDGWDWQARRSASSGSTTMPSWATPRMVSRTRNWIESSRLRCGFPYIEVRRSTGGSGIHLYAFATKPASPRPIIASTPPWLTASSIRCPRNSTSTSPRTSTVSGAICGFGIERCRKPTRALPCSSRPRN